MLYGILLTLNILVCIALIGVVLLQRSEGGALGMGGGNSGFMTARGAGDLLTRTTWILATIFVVLSLALTLLAGRERSAGSVTDNLKVDAIDLDALKKSEPAGPAVPAPTQNAPLIPTPSAPAGSLSAPIPQPQGVPAPTAPAQAPAQ
ncbi:MAG TPA: preprotein translocase subunit SecG [Phenylobacterium sp.]|nr:preprotein translocase subunit SecG [Phenylobacterium sp.]